MIKIKSTNEDWTAVYESMSWWKDDIVKNAKVLVVGGGALGNEVIKNLVLLGVGNVFVVDFDTVELSNLSRSILFNRKHVAEASSKIDAITQSCKEINPEVNVVGISGDITCSIGKGYLREADVIIGCVDNRLARLYINRYCALFGKTWINGGIDNLQSILEVFDNVTNCYECNLKEAEWRMINYKLGCADVAQKNISQGRIPTTPISASFTGALQVQEALKVIHGYQDKIMSNSLYYEGMNTMYLETKPWTPHKDTCESNLDHIPQISECPLSYENSLTDLINWLEANGIEDYAYVELDFQYCFQLQSKKTDKIYEGLFPLYAVETLLGKEEFRSHNPFVGIDSKNKIPLAQSDLRNTSLKAFGVPQYDVIKIVCENSDTILLQLQQ